MELREGTSGRVQPVTGQYLAHPSVCAVCSRPPRDTEEPFLDLKVELDYFGCFYLCTDCASEIAESISYIPPQRHHRLRAQYEELAATVLDQHQKINYLKGLLDARINLAGSSEPDSDGIVSIPVLEDESGQDSVDEIIDGLEPVLVESGKDD